MELLRSRKWHPTPVLLPGKSHGWMSLEGCSPWGRWGSDMTEWLHFHFSLSCIEEGNGNPLQCSCLENPRDGASWWAAVYGVAQSRTWLKWLSSSSVELLKLRHALQVRIISFIFWIPYSQMHTNTYTQIVVVVHLLSHVQIFATSWTVAYQAPLSIGFPRQEY